MASKSAESRACHFQAAGFPDEGGEGEGVMNGNAEPDLGERAGGKAKGDREEENDSYLGKTV